MTLIGIRMICENKIVYKESKFNKMLREKTSKIMKEKPVTVLANPFSWSEYFYTFGKEARQRRDRPEERWETWKTCVTGKQCIADLGYEQAKAAFFRSFCIF